MWESPAIGSWRRNHRTAKAELLTAPSIYLLAPWLGMTDNYSGNRGDGCYNQERSDDDDEKLDILRVINIRHSK